MDDIEKKLYHDLNLEIEIPAKCEEIIRGALYRRKKHYSWMKIATAACASLLITAGVVYAGTKVIETIWKEPTKVVGYATEQDITEEEKSEIMTKDEAIKKAEIILKNFGYKDENIKLIELEKYGYSSGIIWRVETYNNISLEFDAKGGKAINLFNQNALDANIEGYHTTKENAEKTARKLCNKFGYDLSEYEYVEINSNMETEEESYIWYISFYKVRDGLIDRFNEIEVGYIPEINDLYYFIVSEGQYENNPVEISEEQAKETALKAEEKTNIGYNVKNTTAKLDIVSMNGDAYLRTTDYKQFCEQKNGIDYPDEKHVEYITDSRIRTAWVVEIEYDVPEEDILKDTFNNLDLGYTYFVDATTGEIIGGQIYSKPIIIK